MTQNFNIPNLAPQKYNLVLDPADINKNSFSYQFYDAEDKRIKYGRIYSPFLHLKNGFVFKGEKDPNKDNKVLIRLVENNTKIRCTFLHSINDKWMIGMNLYRDMNAKFVREKQSDDTYRWFSTNPNLIWHAEMYARYNKQFRTADFMKHLYFDNHHGRAFNGKYPAIAKLDQSIFAGDTQPFIQRALNVEIKRNKPFLIPGSANKKRHNFGFGSILDKCDYVGNYQLTDHDRQEIEKDFPNFSFSSLGEYVSTNRRTRTTQWETNDLILFPSTTFLSGDKTNIFDPKLHFMKFICSNSKYSDYLDSNDGIFYFDSYRDLPGDLNDCEKLFDKDVLEIKKLVNDIGNIRELTEDEQLNLILYDDSNIIEETFIQRFNKQLQLYGFISVPFLNLKKNNLINLQNLLPFWVKLDIQKENITFELLYLEKEDTIATDDNKIHNLSIVNIEKSGKMPIVEREVTIEGLQSFDTYQKLNPLDIKITDNEIFKRLIFKENRKIKYRFIPNSILLSSSVQEETEVIFLTVSGLNEAKDIFINGKLYKPIGCIFTNEIEGWGKIKKTSNWVSCKLSNSKYPFGAKHLGFEFDTTSLRTLLDFSLNLIDQNGKEITFLAAEQKVPALNFTIQIIS